MRNAWWSNPALSILQWPVCYLVRMENHRQQLIQCSTVLTSTSPGPRTTAGRQLHAIKVDRRQFERRTRQFQQLLLLCKPDHQFVGCETAAWALRFRCASPD